MSSPLKQNTTTIQNLIDTINALPEAGTDLPELTNEGSASDLLSGKQLIDQDGNIVTGTIATKTASNLTASGATVTVPAGYYATQATKSVATTTQATPSVSIDANGKITATATQTAGYVTAGTKTGTKQLTTQATKTITPSTSSQTAVASGVYTTGAVTVAAIPSSYIQPSGTLSVTANGTHDVKNYASVNVNVGSGDSGSGTSDVKTCTLSGMSWYPVYYTTVENGEIVYKSGPVENFTGTITVLCDSLIYYATYESDIGDPAVSGGFEILYYASGNKHIVLKAPSTANAVGEYWVSDEPIEDEIPDL